MRLSCGGASVQIDYRAGLVYLSDLRGTGGFADMRNLVRRVQRLAVEGPLYFAVSASSDRAVRLLERYGASKYVEVWKLGS